MNKPIFKTQRVVIPAGEVRAEAQISIDQANTIFAGAAVKNDQDAIVRLSLEENGQRIQEPLAAQWWDGQLGTFQQRGIQLAYQGGTTLTVIATTSAALAENVEVEFAFQLFKQPVYNQGADGTIIPGETC